MIGKRALKSVPSQLGDALRGLLCGAHSALCSLDAATPRQRNPAWMAYCTKRRNRPGTGLNAPLAK